MSELRDDLGPLAKLIGDAVVECLSVYGWRPGYEQEPLEVGEAVLKALDGRLHGDEYGTIWFGEPGDRENGSTDVADADFGDDECSQQWVFRMRWV